MKPCPSVSGSLTSIRLVAGPLLASTLLLTVMTTSCSSGGDGTASPASVQPAGASLDLELAMQLLSQSWMAQAAADPSRVTQLIDAPGGEGWLRLFHGDLQGAEELFLAAAPTVDPASKGASRAGQSRVHLARARALLVTAEIQSEAATALARYREKHRDQVRHGPLGAALARLVLQAAGEAAAVEVADSASGAAGDSLAATTAALHALYELRQAAASGSPPGALPQALPKLTTPWPRGAK